MAIFEIIFNILYLSSVIVLSLLIYKRGNTLSSKLFAIMGLLLGFGDAFHLIPRIISHIAGDFAPYAFYLGVGKLITSITMTIFYLLLLRVFELEVKVNKPIRNVIYGLVLIRFIILFLPGNEWALNQPSLLYPILRNVPFAIIGGLMIVEFYKSTPYYKRIALWIFISFVCYILVVVGAYFIPAFGAFMMPKTVAYLMIVIDGFRKYAK